MFNLHVIQAKNGDCFILEFGSSDKSKYILIDGGPSGVYEDSLRKVLSEIKKKSDKLELVILSHIDDDHIIGLLDLLEERYIDKREGTSNIIKCKDIWFNSFRDAYEINKDDESDINTCIDNINRILEKEMEKKTRSYRLGTKLSELSSEKELNLRVNKHFDYKAVTCENISLPTKFGNLELKIIGPNNDSVQKLRTKWLKWMKDDCLKLKIRAADKKEAIKADASKPNLSSIMILAKADNKKILLTGDGLGKHIIEGLKQNNLLGEDEKFFVDVLKIPHHGSNKNVDAAFFETVIADNYVISGDGSHHNPELMTLEWIVNAAKNQNRKIKLYCTNRTDNIDKLIKKKKPVDHGYELIIMGEAVPSIVINLSD
ncbi:MAG: MBL fold metallo-hydrolase [Asgard group archaeon]|nr:MBL fold metallo-hydrolase [Asgard group archaeon]